MSNDHEARDLATHTARRRLTLDQEQNIARMYAAGGASNGEIRRTFEISEPTLYRVLQKHSVPLHRRGTPSAKASNVGRRAAALGLKSRAHRSTGAVQVLVPTAPGVTILSSGGSAGQFRVVFRGERVFDALDIRDALRQAQSAGGLDVLAIRREK